MISYFLLYIDRLKNKYNANMCIYICGACVYVFVECGEKVK